MDLFTVDTVGDQNVFDENREHGDSKISYSYDRIGHVNDSKSSDDDDEEGAEESVEKETANDDNTSNDDEDEYDFELYGGEKKTSLQENIGNT